MTMNHSRVRKRWVNSTLSHVSHGCSIDHFQNEAIWFTLRHAMSAQFPLYCSKERHLALNRHFSWMHFESTVASVYLARLSSVDLVCDADEYLESSVCIVGVCVLGRCWCVCVCVCARARVRLISKAWLQSALFLSKIREICSVTVRLLTGLWRFSDPSMKVVWFWTITS